MEFKEVPEEKYEPFMNQILRDNRWNKNTVRAIPYGTLIVYDKRFEKYASNRFKESIYWSSLNDYLEERNEDS